MQTAFYIRCMSLWVIMVLGASYLFAQTDTSTPVKLKVTTNHDRAINAKKKAFDTTRQEHKREEYFHDTIKRERRKFDSTLFSKISDPSTSDYAEDLGKIYQVLSHVPVVTQSFVRLDEISNNLDRGDSALTILKESIFLNDRNLNITNLQMFNSLLDEMDKNTGEYTHQLTKYDSALDKIRQDIDDLRKDSLMLHIFRDTTLKNQFQPQLQQLKAKWRLVDSLVTENGQELNTLKSQVSAHAITIKELLYRVDTDLQSAGDEAFGKELGYLWEPTIPEANYSKNDLAKALNNERWLTRYYFSNSRSNRFWLLITGLVFFGWVWGNFRSLRKLGKVKAIEPFGFKYINPYPVKETLIFVLSLAPLFDFHAPAIYIEGVQFLLMLLLTVAFWKHGSRTLFYSWCIFFFLFLLLLVIRGLGLSGSLQRWLYLLLDTASFTLGVLFLLFHKKIIPGNPSHESALINNAPGKPLQPNPLADVLGYRKWIYFAVGLFLLLCLLANICNIFGRITLSQIFRITAVYSLVQIISLGLFVQLILESFLLQIQTSRIRKKYPAGFDYRAIIKSILTVSAMLAMFLWLIVFTTNLNLFDMVNDTLVDLFTAARHVGSFSFTVGGIVLFLSIIWLANFLQKYIAYFFGDTGDDASIDDKGQRSKLLVTRLIFLVGGFLLAVAASGLAVDRITVVIGALGVGIGLGLQSIVNNFVSGIILIFDRPVRIGDLVEVGDKKGRIKEIGIRSSTLLTEEGAEVIIPNGDMLSNHIVNWTLSNNHARVALAFTINKPIHPEDNLKEEINNIIKKNRNILKQKDSEIMLTNINSKTSELKVYFWISDITQTSWTSGEIRTALYGYLEKKELLIN